MCMSPPKDNSAQIARQAEERRQADIKAGTEQVNDVFAQFDDDYFSGVQKASNEYYLPGVDNQYEDARRKLVLNLGGAGTLNGSAGARKLGALDEDYAKKKADYANQGVTLAQQYRGDVESNRMDILNQLSASANPSAAAAAANARAQSLTAPPAFSPIGNLFGDLAQYGANNLAIEATGRGPGFNTGLFNNPARSGAGSSRVVA
jgi:hypothetical protein